MADDADSAHADPETGEPLTSRQRLAAFIAGTVAGGAGGVSVFMTTNQAGSVALIAVGALFLIMGVNGMPILGAKFKDVELTMEPRRRKVVEQARQERPEEGNLALDMLQQVDPGARTDPVVIEARIEFYRQEIREALLRVLPEGLQLGASITWSSFNVGLGPDLVLHIRGFRIEVEISYSSTPDVQGLSVSRMNAVYGKVKGSEARRLFVTNAKLTNKIAEVAESYEGITRRVQFVRWVDQQDDTVLQLAVYRLMEYHVPRIKTPESGLFPGANLPRESGSSAGLDLPPQQDL